ncbi:MAG: sigma 54-interacting transcriptional regulator [Myxococcota bacterium]
MPVLIVQRPEGPKRIPVVKAITRIGSDASCEVRIEDTNVAADHAQLIREDDGWVLSSLGRARSLLVNGKKEKRARLRDGDLLRVGEHELVFRLHDAAVATEHSADDHHVAGAYRDLLAFSEKLLRTSNLDDLLAALMDNVIERTRADKGFLVLFDNGEPQVRVARNVQKENIVGAQGELSDTILQKVIKEQRPVVVADALNDREFSASASIINLRLSSVMCVPLTEGPQLLGLIYLGSSRVASLFEPAMLELVTIYAAQASLLIRNAMLLDNLRSDNLALRQAVQDKRFGEIIGASTQMQEVFRKVRKVAPTDVSVLITGETGTGKELIAREIHVRSNRADKPFVVVNCGAIPENLMESELFGHVRGAFTGAVATRIGRFQAATGGTLFLDEIGELPPGLQVKLLRALQEKNVTKVGDTKPETVDIRVLAATNKDLARAIESGAFREDLFYRLNVVGIHLPPLREREEDLMLIARYFLRHYVTEYSSHARDFSPQCVAVMKKYGWPGNIRQLENRIKKAVIMAEHVQLGAEDLEVSDKDLDPVVPLNQAREDFQRRYINEVLERNNGNRTKTAHDLGVDPRTIFRHLEREDEGA